jgi:hypothetical protein
MKVRVKNEKSSGKSLIEMQKRNQAIINLCHTPNEVIVGVAY